MSTSFAFCWALSGENRAGLVCAVTASVLICASALLCLEDAVFLEFFATSASYIDLPPPSQRSLSLITSHPNQG